MLYIELVLKLMLPLDASQSSGPVLTLAECLIQHHSLGKWNGTLHHSKSIEHQTMQNC